MAKAYEKLTFTTDAGHELAGRLELPVGPPRAFAIFAHCFTCTKNSRAATDISRKLANHGFAVLRFDFTGLGASGGDFAHSNFTSNVADLVAAADHLAEHYESPRLLIGHSLGGAAVLAATKAMDSVEAVCTIGAPADPAHVKHLFGDSLEKLESEGEAEVNIGGRPFTMRKQFLEDIDEAHLDLRQFRTPLLVMHSPVDEIVGIENAEAIYMATRGFRSFINLGKADHLLTNHADTDYVAAVLAAWATRYVTLNEVASSEAHEEGEVVVEEWAPPYTNRVSARGHRLIADEPASVGGRDAGPNPYEYLLAALGACTSMTLRMYAERKKWPLEKVTVRLNHEKIHAKDCEDCETKDGKVDRITKQIEIEGALDDAQRARLREIAGRCPVNRTLLGEITIVED